MENNSRNLPLLMGVANALGPLRDRVVFVGGATVNLYSTSPATTPEPRITIDVDCIIEVAPLNKYYELEDELRALGFNNDIESGIFCRWNYNGLVIDVMPIESKTLGFSNLWYPSGFMQSILYQLPDGTFIKILDSIYFVATKLVAFRNRGLRDIRTSQDLEDLVHVIDNRPELVGEIGTAASNVQEYIVKEITKLLRHNNLLEALECTLAPGSGDERKFEIEKRLKRIANREF